MFVWWLKAFALTLAIEVPICCALLGVGWGADARALPRRLGRALLAGVLASALTHPVLWLSFALVPWMFENYWLAVGLWEVGIAVVEAAVLWAVARPGWPAMAVVTSSVMNGTSFGVGLIAAPYLFT